MNKLVILFIAAVTILTACSNQADISNPYRQKPCKKRNHLQKKIRTMMNGLHYLSMTLFAFK